MRYLVLGNVVIGMGLFLIISAILLKLLGFSYFITAALATIGFASCFGGIIIDNAFSKAGDSLKDKQ